MRTIREFLSRRRGRRSSKTQVKGWFYRQSVSGEYYTPHPVTKSKYHIPGDGTKPPTPKELYDALQEHPKANVMREGCLLHEYDGQETEETPVPLPPGCYKYFPAPHPEQPESLVPLELRDDNVVKMPGITQQIVKDVRLFLENEQLYRDIGIQYRRGVLLYGPPGQGKTTMLREMIKDEVPADSIIIFLSELPSLELIKKLQNEEADRLKVIIFEELTAIVGRNKNNIENILDFLDGETSLDRALIFGTTNYPESLPGNIVDRPSRFDRLIKVGNPNKETRIKLLEFYLSRKPTEAEIEAVNDMSVAAIKEAAILSRLHSQPVEKAIEHLKKVKDLVKKDFEESSPISFSRGNDFDDFDF